MLGLDKVSTIVVVLHRKFDSNDQVSARHAIANCSQLGGNAFQIFSINIFYAGISLLEPGLLQWLGMVGLEGCSVQGNR